MPTGSTAADVAEMLERSGAAKAAIVRLPHARGLLCGMGGKTPADDARATATFNRLAGRLLRAPPWCARCDRGCDRVLSQWLTSEQIGGVRPGREFCLRTPAPPRFRQGQCVSNAAIGKVSK